MLSEDNIAIGAAYRTAKRDEKTEEKLTYATKANWISAGIRLDSWFLYRKIKPGEKHGREIKELTK